VTHPLDEIPVLCLLAVVAEAKGVTEIGLSSPLRFMIESADGFHRWQ
jgi:hypothetical protein